MNRAKVALTAIAALAGVALLSGCGSGGTSAGAASGGGVFARLTPVPTVVPSTPGPTLSTTPPTFTLPPTTSSSTPSGPLAFNDGATLLSDDFSSDMGWPTVGDTDVTYTLKSDATPSQYVIAAGKGFEYFPSPDESSLTASELLDVIVDVKIRPSVNVGAEDGFGVFCRNANRMRYIFQVNHGATPSDLLSWQIIRDEKGQQTVLKKGTTSPGPATYEIAGGCVTDTDGVTHLGMSVNGTEVGETQDTNGLASGAAGIFATAFTAKPTFTAFQWTLDSATYK